MPNLRELRLEMDPDLIALFADTLILPRLDWLTVFANYQPWKFLKWSHFMHFVTPFSISLSELALYGCHMDSMQVIELMIIFPNLTCLKITNTIGLRDWARIFQFLTLRFAYNGQLLSSSDIYLKETIIQRPLRWIGLWRWTYDQLVTMLESRRWRTADPMSARLLSFTWLVTDSIGMQNHAPDAYSRLMRLAEEGLRVKTTSDRFEKVKGSYDWLDGDPLDYSSDDSTDSVVSQTNEEL